VNQWFPRGRSTRLPETKCHACGAHVDAASHANRARPKPGDLSVCAYCAAVGQYDEALAIRAFDTATLDAENRADLEEVQLAVRRRWGS
jgi:hypothetical protein